MYDRDFLIDKLKELWDKYGKIQTKLIDKEPNFPTRTCFVREFGSIENACRLIGYDYKKSNFTLQDAQKVLDKRNGHFDILEFSKMREHAKLKCRECNHVFLASPDSLLRNKTEEYFGCPNCNHFRFIKKIEENNLKYISEDKETKKILVQCKICNSEFEGYVGNITNQKFLCQFCSQENRRNVILNKPRVFGKTTVKHQQFIEKIKIIINNNDLKWFYFLGLLMSDGHFDINANRISLWLNKKDKQIIKDISVFLGSKVKYTNNVVGIDFCLDNELFNILIDKYNINNTKTYTPCNISSLKQEYLIAFIIGFIDGDGHIRYRTDSKTPVIVIKLHKSWAENLEFLSKHLYAYFNILKYPKNCFVQQKQGTYASVSFGNQIVIKGLYDFIKKNNIPCLKRKWNKIGEYYNEVLY